jgi:hypothetical protein
VPDRWIRRDFRKAFSPPAFQTDAQPSQKTPQGQARRFALADSRLNLIDHKARHPVEEFPKKLLGLCRQRSFPKSTVHQAHPSVAGSLIYMERRMPRAETWMPSLFDVSLRPSEPANQEIPEALLGAWKICRGVHRPQKVILRNLSIEGGDQACKTFRANHRINFEFLHFLSSPIEVFPMLAFHAGIENARCIFDFGVGPAIHNFDTGQICT